MKTVIVIVGAARSGSTLLAKAIGGHTMCFTMGEINRFNQELENLDTHCGCAKKLLDCDFWTNILKHLDLNSTPKKDIISSFNVGIFNKITKKNKVYKLIPTVLFGRKYNNINVDKEIENTFTLFSTLFKESKSNVMIDSSKNLFRALVLASRAPKNIDFRFIQLVRDGRGVLNSSLKSSYKIKHSDGITRKYEGVSDKNPKKIVDSWLYINLRNFLILKLFRKRKTKFIRYEDFTANPSIYLKNIYEWVQLDYQKEALNLGENENHILGGNSSRINAKKIIKQDDAWREKLNKDLLKKFNRKAGWFNKLIGYK